MTRSCVALDVALLLLAGCARPRTGPAPRFTPAPNKPLHAFAEDEVVCRQYAAEGAEGEAEDANWMQAATAALGTSLEATIGGGKGAAIGAGAGGLGGKTVSGIGSSSARTTVQQRDDGAFDQRQYTRGNQAPGTPVQVGGRRG